VASSNRAVIFRMTGEALDDSATEAIAIGAATIKARQFSMRILAGNL
jgi:hypothetical protein